MAPFCGIYFSDNFIFDLQQNGTHITVDKFRIRVTNASVKSASGVCTCQMELEWSWPWLGYYPSVKDITCFISDDK